MTKSPSRKISSPTPTHTTRDYHTHRETYTHRDRESSTPSPSFPALSHSTPPRARSPSRSHSPYDFVFSRPTMYHFLLLFWIYSLIIIIHVGSAELGKKIEELRSDPTKRAELEDRIAYHKVLEYKHNCSYLLFYRR